MRSTVRRYIRLAAAVLAAAVLAGCAPPEDAPEGDQDAYVLDTVMSACDDHGNRVYVRRGARNGTLAVVGQDPTCAAVAR